MPAIRIKRGTRSQVSTAAAASGLAAGELYLVTDESRVDVGTSVSASTALAKKSEVDAKQDTITATGILKGAGAGSISAATAGTDYAAPGSTTTYTVVQNFAASGITLKGSSTGITTFASANASATNYTITFPASTGTAALTSQTFYIGTTQVAIDRASAALTLNGITLTDPAIVGTITEDVYPIVDSGSPAVDINPSNGSIQTWTLGANRTPTANSFAEGESVTLMIDDGTAYSVTWTTIGVVWKTDNGSAPALLTTGFTPIVLWKIGSTIYGARIGNA